jgi:Ca2+-transporting ATPase
VNTIAQAPWHTLSAEQTGARLAVDVVRGLDAAEVEARRALHGRNELAEQQTHGVWWILLRQFTDFMIVVLLLAAAVAAAVGEPMDSAAIVVIVVLNGVIGFVQEYRAEQAVTALRNHAAPSAHVIRAGQPMTIPAVDLVPGDAVVLEAGNVVPADLRLVEAVQLKTDEAVLTGESVPLEKVTTVLTDAALPIGDRLNMAYKGTLVTNGRARGIVVASGMATELGKIAALLAGEDETVSPLQQRLARFGKRLALVVLAICAVVFATGLLRGEPPILMFLTAVSLAVAAIPEALPAVVTASLALGARRMVTHRALIRRLPAVETLGSVTYICSDKTGTLTLNDMRVEVLYADRHTSDRHDGRGDEPWRLLFTALALSNDALANEAGEVMGDPSEVALYQAALAAGYDKLTLEAAMPRVAEIPFSSERRRMTTLHRDDGGVLAFTKGAPESVLTLCSGEACGDRAQALDAEQHLRQAEAHAADGLRVVAVAYRRWPAVPEDLSPDAVERDLVFVGLAAMMDPARAEAAEAVALCRSAGITPVMITGDHPGTARAVARRIGLSDDDTAVTGQELARMSDAELADAVRRVRIYARASPEQKIRIVQALQEHGEIVAVTGDGVNDAPALKRADIGVSMGLIGTDVAREASDMVLLDDNFATIVAAIREGRRIYDNIRKFVRYALAANAGEIWTIFLAPFLGLPIPLLPIHILWINLVTDGLPGLALAAEPEERGVMQRAPRPPGESLFARGLGQHVLWVGILLAAVALLAQAWALRVGSPHSQTMVFTVLTLAQMGHVLAIRSEEQPSWRLPHNLPLLGAVLLTIVLQMLVVYVPIFQPILETAALSATELVICLVLSSTVFLAVEAEKALVRHGWLYRAR